MGKRATTRCGLPHARAADLNIRQKLGLRRTVPVAGAVFLVAVAGIAFGVWAAFFRTPYTLADSPGVDVTVRAGQSDYPDVAETADEVETLIKVYVQRLKAGDVEGLAKLSGPAYEHPQGDAATFVREYADGAEGHVEAVVVEGTVPYGAGRGGPPASDGVEPPFSLVRAITTLTVGNQEYGGGTEGISCVGISVGVVVGSGAPGQPAGPEGGVMAATTIRATGCAAELVLARGFRPLDRTTAAAWITRKKHEQAATPETHGQETACEGEGGR